MKITPQIPQIPFTERVFNVEMTGLELAVIHLLTAQCNGGIPTLGAITDGMYRTLEKSCVLNQDFNRDFNIIQTNKISLTEFKEKIDKINK